MSSQARCYHCADALPPAGAIADADRAVCCPGCAAATELIEGVGLGDYYALRAAASPRPQPGPLAGADWDDPAWQGPWVQRSGSCAEATLLLRGVRCAACAWLIERALGALPGVERVDVNIAHSRVHVAWNASRARLSALVARLEALGYGVALPSRGPDAAADGARRRELLGLAVAGLGTMQAMMVAEALYFGEAGSMPIATRDTLRWLALALSAPVVFYAGLPFLRGALRELRARQPGMDLLVAGAVLLAWGASLVETLRGGPAIYVDAAAMFVLLLLGTRWLERSIRDRAAAEADLLARTLPELATRVRPDGTERVPVSALRVGDRIRVRPGEALAADGVLIERTASFSEAVVSGESRAVAKQAGDEVSAGSIALLAPADVRLTRVGADTGLARLARMIERGRARRPRIARAADRWAARFIVVLFGVAALTAAGWAQHDAGRALGATLAVLAVSCPCALSLAVPAALAAAQARASRHGILVLDPDALAALARVDSVLFDKTGTLSEGRGRIEHVDARAAVSLAEACRLAAALQREVVHPRAAAFAPHADPTVVAHAVQVYAGAGIEGTIDGVRYRLGSTAFALGVDDGSTAIVLAGPLGERARFEVSDPLRGDARACCARLRALGLTVELLSGDAREPVAAAAAACGITAWSARCTPERKLARLGELQGAGRVVLMVGDGINDAPVLAGADASIAMGEGAALAQAQAGILIASGRLGDVAAAVEIARATREVVGQNLAWATAYNVAMLPLAALGWLAPWAAALGMCASSLLVTLNAARLAAPRPRRRARAGEPIIAPVPTGAAR
jgi:Cu2+-exporting ATPase